MKKINEYNESNIEYINKNTINSKIDSNYYNCINK